MGMDKFVLIGAAGLIGYGIISLDQVNRTKMSYHDPATGTYSVSNGQYDLSYRHGAERTLAVTVSMTSDMRLPASRATTVHYFDDSAKQKFVRRYGKGASCPASFYNRYARHHILIGATDEIATQLSDLPKGSMRESRRWYRLGLRGHCLIDMEGTRNGETVLAPSNLFDDCMTFLVTDVSVSEQGV